MRHRRPWLLVAGAVVGVALICFGVLGSLGLGDSRTTVTDMAGHQVKIDESVVPAPSSAKAMDARPVPGARFQVSSVGLDVPLAGMNAVSGVVVPPGFQDAYWIRNIGVGPSHPEAGTVFVVMHSIRGGGVGPGNYLIDVRHGTSRLSIGTTIRVADVSYQVTGSESIDKTALASTSSVWESVPNRLVVITCLQKPNGAPSTNNLVITAARVP